MGTKIIRYSLTAFESQEQTYHIKYIQYHFFNKFKIEDYPIFMRMDVQYIQEQKVNFYKEHIDDLKSGIWCFIDGYKNNQSLNHLKRKVPCWEVGVLDDIECYNCNLNKLTTISDPYVLWDGCYILQREL